LTQVNIVGDGSTDDGIFGTSVNGLTLTNVDISGNAGSGAATDRGVEINNLSGAATVTDSTITTMPGNLFHVINTTGTLNLIVTGSTFRGSADGADGFGGDGMLIEANGTSTIVARVTGNTFDQNESDHFQWATDGGASTGHLTLSGNTFTTTTPAGVLGGGVTISPAGASDLTFLIENNTVNGNRGGGSIDVTAVSTNSGMLVQGVVRNNTIGTAGVANSGSEQAGGISAELNGNGTMIVEILNNLVQQYNGAYGIEVVNRTGTGAGGTLHATVSGNTVLTPTIAAPNRAIHIGLGTSAGTDQGQVYLDLHDNHTNTGLARDIGITQVASVDLYMPGYVGDPDSIAAVVAFLTNLNPDGGTIGITDGLNETMNFLNGTVLHPASPLSPLIAVSRPWQPEQPITDDPVPVAPETVVPETGTGDTGTPPPTPDAPGHAVIVDDGVLTQAELDYLVEAAIQRWIEAGATAEQVAAMRATNVDIVDMAGIYLGTSSGNHISIDADAAGFGWFLDTTPGDNAEFTGTGTRLTGTGDAAGRMDLLTTIMHELGHQIGIDDTYSSGDAADLMYGYAGVGERRLPTSINIADADGTPTSGTAFALAPVNVGTLPAGTAVQINYRATVNPYGPGVIAPLSNTTTITGSNFSTVTVVHGLVVDTLTVGGQIFVDADGDNVFDVGEGVAGVTLNLYVDLDGSGALNGAELTTVIATTTTGAGGVYAFSSLGAGNYVVEVAASNFASGAALEGRASLNSVVDPDDNVDGDDNGVVAGGGAFRSGLITLDFNT
ncbi:MAG: hypothetical protein EOP19_08930, partial [Hyphomicrobiales bacterium]